jgi:SH3-like domain-containing protein
MSFDKNRILPAVRVLCLALALLFVCAAGGQTRMLSVAGSKANLRSGPGVRYAVRWVYGRGLPLRLLSRRGNWYKVTDFEGSKGWIYKKLLSNRPYVIVKKKQANIRSGPGTKYKLLGRAKYGVVFKTLRHRHGWVKVRHAKGLVGWISRDLLWGW